MPGWVKAPPAWVKSPIHAAVVAALIRAPHDAGMTQRDVAKKLGRPPSFIAKVEKIERGLSVIELVEWADAVGTSAQQILSITPRSPIP
jgi:transcriptional regulator with XRE-family HTH domain